MSKEDIAAKMQFLVKQYHVSGQTRKAFALAHGISAPKLDYWIKKLSKSAVKPKKKSSGADFVALGVDVSPLRSRAHLLIRLPSGVAIEIPL